MIGMNVWWVYLAPQNIPSAIVLTLGNKVGLYFSLGWVKMISTATQHTCTSNTSTASTKIKRAYKYYTRGDKQILESFTFTPQLATSISLHSRDNTCIKPYFDYKMTAHVTCVTTLTQILGTSSLDYSYSLNSQWHTPSFCFVCCDFCPSFYQYGLMKWDIFLVWVYFICLPWGLITKCTHLIAWNLMQSNPHYSISTNLNNINNVEPEQLS